MGFRSIPRTIAYSLPLLLLLLLAVSAQESGAEAERGGSRGSKDLGRRSKIKFGILEVNTLGVKTEGDSVAIGLHVDSGLGIFDAFIASLSMILVSEIGDETFIIAALMAMRHPRSIVLSGALSALFIMTVLSTGLGRIVPNLISRKHTNSAATVLYLFFGLRLLYIAWRSSDSKSSQKKEIEEVEEKLESGQGKTPFRRFFSRFCTPIFLESFILTFLAEWGDRSQIATIALATHKNAIGVAVGATLGHTICTSVAVVGGRTKEAEEEEDEEDSLSGEGMKNSFRSLALPKPNISTGIHRLVKGFKNFSQQFVYKDDMEEVLGMDMEIGCPTDVKHVTHIGWDASTSASAASATTDPFGGWDNLVSPDLLSVSPVSWRQFELSVPSQSEAAVPPLVHGSSSKFVEKSGGGMM
ncbi:GDT1-like protein 4 [Pyrus ussuriensis x Pyrus communis]|uniref:GDT1-like protein 4 n=1 Tax=Pyrus ussuriensis x Pyrus communis TaxID=2448454 RepID=A0A5N5H093_9ROSA|nr:GDT1-like protein 4 [Pyrus ussuriensis x Pyrus communis]